MNNIETDSVRKYCDRYGYRKMENIPFNKAFTDYVIQLYSRINEPYVSHMICPYSEESIKNNAKQFFDVMGYNLHEVYINSIPGRHFVNGFEIKVGTDSPFNIPIEYVDTHSFYGDLDINEEDNGIWWQYFNNIKISKILNEVSLDYYINEITKTQTMGTLGTVWDGYNSDVLGIFNELLISYHKNVGLFYMHMNYRINKLFSSFTRFYIDSLVDHRQIVMENKPYDSTKKEITVEQYKTYTDLVSTLKALNLLATYIQEDTPVRKEIIASINDVFNIKKSMEELLDKYEISMESSINNQKTLKMLNTFNAIKK